MRTPESADALSTEWLTALARRFDADCEVASWEVDSRFGAESLIADVVRVMLNYAGPTASPGSIVMKFPSKIPSVSKRAASNGVYEKEARIYELLAEESDLPVPKLLGVFDCAEKGYKLLVLEDLTPARSGSQVTGCSAEEARVVLSQMAKIHAACWLDPRVPEGTGQEGFVRVVSSNVEAGWEAFVSRYGDRMQPARAEFEWFRENIPTVADHRLQAPWTLMHGDPHPENILFSERAEEPAYIVDWQLSSRGLAAHDVAYFIVGSLAVADRRKHEVMLLGDYYRRLSRSVADNYSYDDFFLDYRAAVVRSMAIPIFAMGRIGAETERGDAYEFADAKFERILAASTDLGAIDALRARMSVG